MENQNLKESLETKINSLKIDYEKKLSEKQKGFLESLLFAQEQIIRLEGKSSILISPREKGLERAKTSLKTKLSEQEVENICQLQSELTRIKMKLESQSETKIELNY